MQVYAKRQYPPEAAGDLREVLSEGARDLSKLAVVARMACSSLISDCVSARASGDLQKLRSARRSLCSSIAVVDVLTRCHAVMEAAEREAATARGGYSPVLDAITAPIREIAKAARSGTLIVGSNGQGGAVGIRFTADGPLATLERVFRGTRPLGYKAIEQAVDVMLQAAHPKRAGLPRAGEIEAPKKPRTVPQDAPTIRFNPFDLRLQRASLQRLGAENFKLFKQSFPEHQKARVETILNERGLRDVTPQEPGWDRDVAKALKFVRERFARLGTRSELPQITCSVYSPLPDSPLGFAHAEYRWAAVKSGLSPDHRLPVLVHEIAHASAFTLFQFSEHGRGIHQGSSIRLPSKTGILAAVQRGWEFLLQDPHAPASPRQFHVLEECAAVAHESAWYRKEGWIEELTENSCTVSLSKNASWQLYLYRANTWLSDPARGAAEDRLAATQQGREALLRSIDGKTIAITLPIVTWSKGSTQVRSAYAPQRAATLLLAPELYPKLDPNAALARLEDDLCRVQVGIGHPALLLRRMRNQISPRAPRFFANLEVDGKLVGGKQVWGASTQFLALFSAAAKLGAQDPKKKLQQERVRELVMEGLQAYRCVR